MHHATQKRLVSELLEVDYKSINRNQNDYLIKLKELNAGSQDRIIEAYQLNCLELPRMNRNYVFIPKDEFLKLAQYHEGNHRLDELAQSLPLHEGTKIESLNGKRNNKNELSSSESKGHIS